MKRSARQRRRLLPLLIAPVIAVTAQPGAAHTDLFTYYPLGWQERDIYYFFVGNSWSQIGDIANRARDGAAQWNSLNQGGFFFRDTGTRALSTDPCQNTPGNNGLFWQGLDGPGGTYAITYVCSVPGEPGRIKAATTVYDGSEPNWYTGTSTPPPGRLDFWGSPDVHVGSGGR